MFVYWLIKLIYICKFIELIDGVWIVVKLSDYFFEICLLLEEDGGGFLILFFDFVECIFDGEIIEDVVVSG